MSDNQNTNMTTEERYKRIYPEGVNTKYTKKDLDENKEPMLAKQNEKARKNAKEMNKTKRKYKKNSLKRRVIIITVKTLITLLAIRGLVATVDDIARIGIEWIDNQKQLEQGMEILKEEGKVVMPEGYCFGLPGQEGYNTATNQVVPYETVVNLVKNEKEIYSVSDEATALYLKEVQGVNQGTIEEVCGRKVTREEIKEAALEAYNKQNQATKGKGGK